MPDQEPTTETSQPSEQAESQNDVKEVSQEQPKEEPQKPAEESIKESVPDYSVQQKPVTTEMPEYLKGMDKFWNTDKGLVEVEKLSESYRNLEGKLGQRKEELTKELTKEYNEQALVDVPESPDAYKLNLPEGDYDDEQTNYMEESPVWQYFKQTAHENKMNQDEVNSMVNMYMEAQKAELPDPNVEISALGDNADARIEAVQLWSKKHLDEDGYASVEHLCSTAQGIQTMEQIMHSIATPSIGDLQGAAVSSAATDTDLKALMADPRYSDPNKRDIAYVNYVTEQFNKKYGNEPADGGSAGKLG
jgi:hypothetical protein